MLDISNRSHSTFVSFSHNYYSCDPPFSNFVVNVGYKNPTNHDQMGE